MKKSLIISLLISLITIIIAGWFIMTTKGTIPTHWNVNGDVDSYGSPLYLLIFPVTSLLTTLLLYMVPQIDPKGENIEKSGPLLPLTMILLTVLMLGIEVIIIRAVQGASILDLITFIAGLLGILFITIGYYLPTVKQNYMMGIRTPWTLHSESVWQKTHQVAKNWFIAVGLLFLVSLLFKEPFNLVIPMVFMALVLVGILIYSYLLFQKEQVTKADQSAKKLIKKHTNK